MTSEIIEFAKQGAPPEEPGNGAREALLRVFLDNSDIWIMEDETPDNLVDFMLAELWMRGFKVVPLEPDDG
jgi:hypothetical protein